MKRAPGAGEAVEGPVQARAARIVAEPAARWPRCGSTRCGPASRAPKSSVRIVSSASSRRCLYSGWARLSSESRKRVPATAALGAGLERPARRRRARRSRRRAAAGSRRAAPRGRARAAPAPAVRPAHVAAGLDPLDDHRVGAGRVRRRAPPRPSRTGEARCPAVRRFGAPQKVTTTSAAAAASNQPRRAKGSRRLTASGRRSAPARRPARARSPRRRRPRSSPARRPRRRRRPARGG